MNRMSWRPLLTGDLLARAREVLADLARSWRADATAELPADWPPEVTATREACLGNGFAGQALLCAYLHQGGGGRRAAELGIELLDKAVATVAVTRMTPTLYAGFPGIAWAANHLAGRLYAPEEHDADEHTDRLLTDFVRRARWPFQFDLISGLTGLGVHGLERLPRPSARECLEAIVDRLGEVAERSDAGIAWLTTPELLGGHWREQAPAGTYYLGMAHGAPGVVAFLAQAWAADVARDRVRPLLEGAVSWLLAQTLAPGSPSRFPNWLVAGQEPTPARLAWCYGDPGVAAALLGAAAALQRDDWRREGLATALTAARRPLAGNGVRDPSLCHGSAGLAHIFNRLYQATAEEELGRAALFWYERLLASRTPGQGHGGFLFARSDRDELTYVPDPGFLDGTAGAGLALLAATTDVEPDWDRVLLTNVPPGSL